MSQMVETVRTIDAKAKVIRDELIAKIKADESKEPKHIVIYCDGGCNNGDQEASRVGYSGIHGFIASGHGEQTDKGYHYTKRGYFKTGLFTGPDNKKLVSSFATSLGGVRQTVHSHPLKALATFDAGLRLPESAKFPNTNNRAEAMGLYFALVIATPLIASGHVASVHLRVDSEYVLNSMTKWLAGWAKNNYVSNGNAVKNDDIWRLVQTYQHLIKSDKLEFTMEWVRGHTDFLGNIRADKNAGEAKLYPADNPVQFKIDDVREAQLVVETDGKKAPKAEKLVPLNIPAMLLAYPRWYYYSEIKEERAKPKRYYYVGRHGEKNNDVEYGYMMSQVVYGVTYCDRCEPFEMLADSFEEQSDTRRWDEQDIYIVDTKLLSSKDVIADVTLNGLAYVDKEEGTYSIGKKVLASRKHPVVAGYAALDQLEFLKRMLEKYVDKDLPVTTCVTDITEHFYGYKKKGKSEELIRSTNDLIDPLMKVKVDHQHTPESPRQSHWVKLSRNMDYPLRRPFVGSMDKEPKVEILTWHEGSRAFRYAIVLTDNSGDASIWCAIYSNLRVLTEKETSHV